MATIDVFTGTTVSSLPCSWEVDVTCCPGWDEYSPELQEAAAEYGALSVWAATGRRFGICTRTVRPCHKSYQDRGIGGYFWSEGTWQPYIFNGVWRNCAGCAGGFGCCSCEPRCQIWLPPPVNGIVAVTFSGDTGTIPSSAYRVDDYQWLVRQDGNCWPVCNNYNVPVTGAGAPTGSDDSAWQVTYEVGIPVPSVLLRAAGELACEWAKACTGQVCALPQRVTSISRQGVSVTLADVDQLLANGLTGLVNVDSIIQRFNPNRITSRYRVLSPDTVPIRRTTTP